jgi:hypothetical protein
MPPKGTSVAWLTIGECLRKLIGYSAGAAAYSDVGVLSLSRATLRYLRRQGITSVGRLLFTRPDVIAQTRGMGPLRFAEICSGIVAGPVVAKFLDPGRRLKSAPGLGQWVQFRAMPPSRQALAEVCSLAGLPVETGMSDNSPLVAVREMSERAMQEQGVGGPTYATMLAYVSGTLTVDLASSAL